MMDVLTVLIITGGVCLVSAMAANAWVDSTKAKAKAQTNDTKFDDLNKAIDNLGAVIDTNAWKPIETCPRDRNVYLWHKDKNMYHIVMMDFDAGTDLAASGYTHWRLRFPDPNDV